MTMRHLRLPLREKWYFFNWLKLQLVGSWKFGVKSSEMWSRVDEQIFSLIQNLSIHIHTSVPAANLWIKTLSVHPQRNPYGPRHSVQGLFKCENCEHWLPPIFAFPRKSWYRPSSEYYACRIAGYFFVYLFASFCLFLGSLKRKRAMFMRQSKNSADRNT